MVTEETLTLAQKHMTGSMLLIKALNGTEARQLVEKDIYYTAGVVRLHSLLLSLRCSYLVVGSREAGHNTFRPTKSESIMNLRHRSDCF